MWNYNLHKQLSLVKNILLSLLLFFGFLFVFFPHQGFKRAFFFSVEEKKHFQFELFISGSQKETNHKWSFQAP